VLASCLAPTTNHSPSRIACNAEECGFLRQNGVVGILYSYDKDIFFFAIEKGENRVFSKKNQQFQKIKKIEKYSPKIVARFRKNTYLCANLIRH